MAETLTQHPVVSQKEWLEARKAFLLKEKELTHLRDKVNAARLELPWVKVEENYTFDTPSGRKSLADLFDGRSQLVVYHFMLAPGWEAGCPGCSFLSDHIDGALPHLNHHDVTYTAISRAPLAEIEAYKKRMGWKFPWASSNGSTFNYDYNVSFHKEDLLAGRTVYNYRSGPPQPNVKEDTELPGTSSFYKDEDGAVFHTFSSYARGIEDWITTLMILDRAPLGRNEKSTMDFVKRHDEYEPQSKTASCCH